MVNHRVCNGLYVGTKPFGPRLLSNLKHAYMSDFKVLKVTFHEAIALDQMVINWKHRCVFQIDGCNRIHYMHLLHQHRSDILHR